MAPPPPPSQTTTRITNLNIQTQTTKLPKPRRFITTTITTTMPSPTNLKIRPDSNSTETFPSSFTKFNTALTAGLLNPSSPPPLTRSSPTLFEMMSNEPDPLPRPPPFPHSLSSQTSGHLNSSHTSSHLNLISSQTSSHLNNSLSFQTSSHLNNSVSSQTSNHLIIQQNQRLADLLSSKCNSPGNQFNDAGSSDVKLTISSKDGGISVCLNVHRHVLIGNSRFFATKMERGMGVVEIADCDDVEVYVETVRLMYCRDLRKKLMKDDVSRVLAILKVSAAIGFDAGVLSCLEYLEAAPWAEDEEEKVASLLSELRLEGVGAGEVLKRVSLDVTSGDDENNNEEVLLRLLHVVLEGKDEKARREMKTLVTKMLRENSSQNDLRKDSLYSACDKCLNLLRHQFLQSAEGQNAESSQIARQADNLHWLLDILIDRQIAEDFLQTWASQSELSEAHSKVPAIHRYEVSRVTARLLVGIGKGQLLASKEARCMLLQTWLVPFYDDFGWMKRASKGLDRHLIEDGLSNTILTLPMAWQQEILLSWFDRFLNSGDDCPNIQRGFEVWWRRAFWRRNGEQIERPRQMRIMNANIENS